MSFNKHPMSYTESDIYQTITPGSLWKIRETPHPMISLGPMTWTKQWVEDSIFMVVSVKMQVLRFIANQRLQYFLVRCILNEKIVSFGRFEMEAWYRCFERVR